MHLIWQPAPHNATDVDRLSLSFRLMNYRVFPTFASSYSLITISYGTLSSEIPQNIPRVNCIFFSVYTRIEPLGQRVFPRVLSAFSMKKYPDKITFTSEVLFNVLTVLSTKLHCTMNNNFQRDLKLIEYEHRMVRIGNTHLNNRRLIEYAIAYYNTRISRK